MFRTIKFSQNWNKKLDNELFTTIRNAGYGVAHGDICAVALNDRIYKWSQCIGYAQLYYAELSPVLIALDTGITDSSLNSVFASCGIKTLDPECRIDFLLLKTIKRPQGIGNAETDIQLNIFK